MSANGIVATTEGLDSDLTQLMYVVPSGQYDRRWVLYDPDLWDLVPCGFTNIGTSQSYCKDALWETKRRVANDSYACPNPHWVFSILRALRLVSLVDVSSRLKPSLALAR